MSDFPAFKTLTANAQKKPAHLHWHRSSGLGGTWAQLNSDGLTIEELEQLLLDLAADVHKQRTGQRAGAVIVEDGEVGSLMYGLGRASEMTVDPVGFAKRLRDDLNGLYRLRDIR